MEPDDLRAMGRDYRLALEAGNKAATTVALYLSALERFAEWLESHGRATEIDKITAADCRGFIDHLLRTRAPATAHNRFRSLRTFFAWLVDEGELTHSPMARLKPPLLPEVPVEIVTEDEMRALLKVCARRRDFTHRRDEAIVRLFYDTGIRRNELADLRLSEIDLDLRVAVVLGKGRRPRSAPFGKQTALSLSRYLRMRRAHKDVALPWLWLGIKGRLTASGVQRVVRERGRQAGIDGLHPHRLRHSFAHEWLAIRLDDSQEHVVEPSVVDLLTSELFPDVHSKPYTNTEGDWFWLVSASKAARWLGHVPFEQIIDQRNAEPTIRIISRDEPSAYVNIGVEVEIPDVDDIEPQVGLEGFTGVQPYKLVLFGEKSSLKNVLEPIAATYRADLYLPTGEISDTMLYRMASVGAEDGRRMIVFCLSDCDPAGWQMTVSIARKLQAFQAFEFPSLEFEVRPIALTPEQVRTYGLPYTPLKESERRADKWRRAMGVEQTEIDALATLNPRLLREIVRDALDPFFDRTLDRRVREAQSEWEQQAQDTLDEQISPDQLEHLSSQARAKLDSLRDEIDAINDALRVVAVDGLDLPELPEVPAAECDPVSGEPLITSDWNYVEQTRRLIAHKAYES